MARAKVHSVIVTAPCDLCGQWPCRSGCPNRTHEARVEYSKSGAVHYVLAAVERGEVKVEEVE